MQTNKKLSCRQGGPTGRTAYIRRLASDFR